MKQRKVKLFLSSRKDKQLLYYQHWLQWLPLRLIVFQNSLSQICEYCHLINRLSCKLFSLSLSLYIYRCQKSYIASLFESTKIIKYHILKLGTWCIVAILDNMAACQKNHLIAMGTHCEPWPPASSDRDDGNWVKHLL